MKTQYWIHKEQYDGNCVQLLIGNSMSFMIPTEKFELLLSELEKFNDKHLYIELNSDIKIEIDLDNSTIPHEANMNYYVVSGGFSMCITFHCFASDIKDMATNLSYEMKRTDDSFDFYEFKYV
jgi:hypothetical protein